LLVKSAVLHIGDEPPRLLFKLTNTSCAPIAVKQISRPLWLSFPVEQIPNIASGASSNLLAAADLSKILRPTSAEVVFSSSAGDAMARVMVITRKPQLVCTPNIIDAWVGPSGERSSSRITISPAVGMLIVRDVRLLGILGAVKAETLQAGFPASPESGAPVELEVQAERLDRGIHQATLQVVFDGPHGPETAEVAIGINVRRPPQLRWAGDKAAPEVRHQTDRQSLALVFHNQSPDGRDGGAENAELIIRSISLTPPRGVSIPLAQLTNLPVRVSGGQSHTAEFELNLKGLQRQSRRQIAFDLEVRTNLQKPLKGTVTLWVEPMQRFEGVVAIDFGSSNTCCAVLSPGGEPELLRLDKVNLVSPTLVSYIDLTRSPPVIETGSRLRERAAIDEDFAASVADGLKRKLRDKRQEIDIRPMVPRRWMGRKASDAAADYLRDLRQLAEVRKAAVFESFILTHPARCPLHQHQRLSAALLQAFGSNEFPVSYISEPIAALVAYIAERAKQEQYNNRASNGYTVASFDLGGGTTDVAIIQVAYERPSHDEMEIVPTVRFCKGVDFGGEDLTDYIKAELEQRCQAIFDSSGANVAVVTERGSGAAPLDVRRNRAALRDAAERFKSSLSDESDKRELRPILLRVRQKDGRTADYPFDFAAASQQGGRDLTENFLAHTKMKVQEIAKMLEQAVQAKNITLDVIQISGKTAHLSIVRQAIEEVFHDVQVEPAPEPKECVVKGACLWQSMRVGKLRLKLPDSMEHMTSSIGVFPPNSAYFVPLLKADMEIPAEGLHGELTGFWRGTESVVLWEDVHGDERLVEYASAARLLDKLGTWEPERKIEAARSQPWTLRLTVRKFELSVEAIGADRDSVRFHPMHRTGD